MSKHNTTTKISEPYLDTVEQVLLNGQSKSNRTGVDTLSAFAVRHKIDQEKGFPLLTTKEMDGFRWKSMIYELLWYLSGEEHIRNLREKTSLWNAWANEDGELDTAYGRFWRRYPIPDGGDQLPGESWPSPNHRWVNEETTDDGTTRLTFDQIQYVIDTLNDSPQSRRIVVNAWHPANATTSTLPPCHYTFVFNVQGNKLNLHLTQRSADIALGVPFNIAAYSIIQRLIAREANLTPGTLSHELVDAHIYCGKGDRGEWYNTHLDELQERMETAERENYANIADWIENTAPPEQSDGKPYDHTPGLLRQLSRQPYKRPTLKIADRPLEELELEDFTLTNYESHPALDFGVAE